ncbi:DUF3846 domain-containing protein [Micromonospora haikouensis]|uniref:DUF3846 domain-containing protein n=1 Tax=Micromonospora haikouensis TaxID=686309 RepID=UPI0036A57AAF
MITAIVIPADPAEPVRLEQLDEHDLGTYQHLVGGNVEVVNLDRPPASLYLNEEGKLLDLPLNQRATVLLWAHSSAFRGRDVIVGTAFVVGPPDAEGDDQTAPAELVELLPGSVRCRVQFTTSESDVWRSDEEVFTDALAAYLHGVQLAQRAAAIREVRVVPKLDEQLREQWFKLGMENRGLVPRTTRRSPGAASSAVSPSKSWPTTSDTATGLSAPRSTTATCASSIRSRVVTSG